MIKTFYIIIFIKLCSISVFDRGEYNFFLLGSVSASYSIINGFMWITDAVLQS